MDNPKAPGNASSLSGILFDVTIQDPKARIQAYLDAYKSDGSLQTFDLALMGTYLQLLDAHRLSNNTATAAFSMVIPADFCNRTGMVHGGAVSLIVDMTTTLCQAPIAALDFWEFGGFSRTLNVTYLRPISRGTEILISCEVVQVGRTLATIQAKIYRRADMMLLCTGEHNKAAVDIKTRFKKL